MVLPWRTACLAVAFGALLLRISPAPQVRAEDTAGYAPGELRAALNGAAPTPVAAPVAGTGPEALTRELPDADDVMLMPAEGPSVAPTTVDVVPASFTGTRR